MGQGSSETLGKMSALKSEQACHVRCLKGGLSVPLIKRKTQKVHYAEITSPGRQVGIVGFHRSGEGHFIFTLPGQEAGGMPAREVVCSLIGSSLELKVFHSRLPPTLAPLVRGFLPPYLWCPFLNLLQPAGGCSAPLCLTCFIDLYCFMH